MIAVGTALAAHSLLLHLADGIWLKYLTLLLLFLGILRLPALPFLRSTRLSDWLRSHAYAMRVEFAERRARFDRPVMFAVEPHGYQCTAIALLFCAYGTRGNAILERYGRVFLDKTRAVATMLAFLIPGVATLFSLFGATTNEELEMRTDLFRGHNLVIVPSGLHGKAAAAAQKEPVLPDRVVVVRRPNERFGFAKLAIEAGAYIVPVLVPDEAAVYKRAFSKWGGPWPFVPMVESWVFGGRRKQEMRVLVGRAIDARDYSLRVADLGRDYYAALEKLGAAHGIEVVFK